MESKYKNLQKYFDYLDEPMQSYFYNLLENCVNLRKKVEEKTNAEQKEDSAN